MENILPQAPSPINQKNVQKKSKFSAVAIVFVIILTIVLFIFGERLITDLNQWLNPAYGQYGQSFNYKHAPSYDELGTSAVNEKVYTRADYEVYKLLIQTAFAVPILLAGFLLYFWMYYKKKQSSNKVIAWPYFIFSIWMLIRVVYQAFYYLIKEYEKIGIYVVLIILASLLTWLAIFVQKKYQLKHNIDMNDNDQE